VDTSFVESDSGKISTRYEFQPSVGTHFMQYRGTWIRVERTREQRMLEPWETVQLTTFGRHRELFVDILEESRMLGNRIILNDLERKGQYLTYTWLYLVVVFR
jgi:chaperone BCS1